MNAQQVASSDVKEANNNVRLLRKEVYSNQSEMAKLKENVVAREAEITKLKADLEMSSKEKHDAKETINGILSASASSTLMFVPSILISNTMSIKYLKISNVFSRTSNDDDEMSEGFFETIDELECMTRETSDVLEEMNDKFSACE
ncbi:Uncharacterized protein Fot_02780 [Forsythia ovata]|uniref:Uncharacterized protein n=1 Tax=Forsythia ovata TaxID=205694 RepID=A0ABD1X7V5_9LAMI